MSDSIAGAGPVRVDGRQHRFAFPCVNKGNRRASDLPETAHGRIGSPIILTKERGIPRGTAPLDRPDRQDHDMTRCAASDDDSRMHRVGR